MTSLLSIQHTVSHKQLAEIDLNKARMIPMMEHRPLTLDLKSKPAPMTNRLAYVDALVDANALVIESIWHNNKSNNTVVPLRTFIQEVLKRSRTTYSTLQTALFYLFRSRPEIESYLSQIQSKPHWEDAYVSCGRRMFLASLVVASKFVQDKTYRNSAWAKIAGLPVAEVNAVERIFLNMLHYRLYINQSTFERWHHLLHRHVEAKTLNKPAHIYDFSCLPFAPLNPDYTEHRSYTNQNLTLVLSPTTFLPPPVQKKRKRQCEQYQQLQIQTLQPPVLSASLPSSIHSSPLQTPTQISPIRMNGNFVFCNSPNNFDPYQLKKRKMSIMDTHSRSYNISHVRQQKRFHL